MLIPAVQLRRIVDGSVDLAFRRWTRPRVRVGTRLRTQVGVIEVTGLSRTTLAAIGAEELRRAGLRSRDELRRHLRPDGDLYRIELRFAGADPRIALRADAALSDADIAALRERLARYDRASSHGPWTQATLAAIRERPATLAAELAADLGLEVVVFKRDVRKLKELGLTESLPVGYRISPRGEAFLAAARR